MRPLPEGVRPYTPADREAVRSICCRTAFRNRGLGGVFEDEALFADYWTLYFTDIDSRHALVIEQDGAVIGYFFGCLDRARFVRAMGRRIVPRILLMLTWRALTGRYREAGTFRFIRWFLLRSWREVPDFPFADFPAFYHCNILRKGYGRGYYTALTIHFLDRLDAEGVPFLHTPTTEPRGKGIWERLSGLDHPDKPDAYAETGSTFEHAVLNTSADMVNRVWGMRTAGYRRWLERLAHEYGL